MVLSNPISVQQPYSKLDLVQNGKTQLQLQLQKLNFWISHMTWPKRVDVIAKMLTICRLEEGDQLIFFSAVLEGDSWWTKCLRSLGVSICETVEKRVISGHNQMSPTDQGSSSLTRLPLHPQVIAAKLFNCPKLPSNDVNCRGHQ